MKDQAPGDLSALREAIRDDHLIDEDTILARIGERFPIPRNVVPTS